MLAEGGALKISAENREKWIRAFGVDPRGSSSLKPYTEMEKAAYEEKLKLIRAGIETTEDTENEDRQDACADRSGGDATWPGQ
jgi:hypothetical protein